MKVSPAFFRSDPVKQLLDRAAKASAVSMSLHYHAHDGNELHILGWGNCKVCSRANKASNGARACCESRMRAALPTLQQHTPVTFVCHLGLTCVSIAALAGHDYVITFGPYIPAEADQEIGYDVIEGLREIEGEYGFDEDVPVELDDLRTIPAGAVSALAEWLHEALHGEMLNQEQSDNEEEPADDEESIDAEAEEKRKIILLAGSDTWVSLAALALACGHYLLAREFLGNRIEEVMLLKKASPESVRAFLMQATSRILERARKMGCATESARQRYREFVSEIETIVEPEMLLKSSMRVLRKVRTEDGRPVPAYLPDLVKEVHKHYKKDYRLSRFAQAHHLAASTVTRALECRINATFSEYLGRIRIEKAQKLLRNSQMPAAKIASKVGIPDQSNFGKMFLRYTGMNPGAYRNKFHRQ